MKILLINPRTPTGAGRDLFDSDIFGSVANGKPFTRMYNGLPLALPTLAGATPPEHSVTIIDEMIEEIDFKTDCDVVGLTAMTCKASRAYEIAAEFMERKIPVIMGGIHASMCPDEVANHVDCVVTGEADELWPHILTDLEHNRLKKKYSAKTFPALDKTHPPRHDLSRFRQYTYFTLQTTRGCPHQCHFCTVTKMNGRKIRKKTPAQVIAEINDCVNLFSPSGFPLIDTQTGKQKTFGGIIFFTDDNFAIDKKHALAVCKAIKDYLKQANVVFFWFTQVNFSAGLDPELLAAMRDANCISLFMGFESLDKETLKAMNKSLNNPDQYETVINNVRKYGMEVTFSTIIGGDLDTPETSKQIIRFINKNNLYRTLINIMTPYPGTELYEKMKAEDRLITSDINQYNVRNIVYRPATCSPAELQATFSHLCENVYDFDSIARRLSSNLQPNSRWRLPLMLRPVYFLMQAWAGFVLAVKGRIDFSSLFKFLKFSFSTTIKGYIPDSLFFAECLDYSMFQKSEKLRLTKLIQKLSKET